MKTYDIIFNSENSSNNKGFNESMDFCIDYINRYNGTQTSYFADYKGGTVSVVCNQTGDTVFEVPVL